MTYARRRWFTSEDDAEILRGLAAGVSLAEIAMSLDRQRGSVENRVRLIKGLRSTSEYVSAKLPNANDLSGEVRCLGGCGKRFVSPDRLRIRVCNTCKKRWHDQNEFRVEHSLCL
jgi:DNA-binding transcriptional MerR regulator